MYIFAYLIHKETIIMLNRIFQTVILAVFVVVLSTTTTSCKKENDTIARIIVKHTNNQVVPNATVTLYAEPTISPNGSTPNLSLTKTNITDSNGKVEFTYELESVLNVEATILIGNDNFQGDNIINLLRGKTTTKVVEISKI